MTRGRPHGRGGFTLMETAVTILIMGVVAMLGYEAFTALIDRRSQIRAAMAETERAAALRVTMEQWFDRGSLGPLELNRVVGSADVGSQSHDMLVVTTRAQNPSTAWAAELLLFIDNNPSTPEQGLTVQYFPRSSGVDFNGPVSLSTRLMYPAFTQDEQLRRLTQSPTTHELDRQVTGWRVEFLDRLTHRWFRARNWSRDQQ